MNLKGLYPTLKAIDFSVLATRVVVGRDDFFLKSMSLGYLKKEGQGFLSKYEKR